jgi:hypothetical protein
VRENGRIKRVYGKPATPYERVLESADVPAATKRALREIHAGLNPAKLYRSLTALREKLEVLSTGKSEGYGKRSYRGPDIRIGKRSVEAAVA